MIVNYGKYLLFP